MLHDLNETLKQLVIERGKLNKDEIEISFDRPTSEWSATLGPPTINFFGYDLRENLKLRSFSFDAEFDRQQRRAERMDSVGIRRVPMRFDISYLVTTWARKSEDEYRLLSRALGALAPLTSLKPENCVGDLRAQPIDLPVLVAQVSETSGNLTDLWSVLDNDMRLGFTITVTFALDPDFMVDTPLVLEPFMRVGQSRRPERERIDAPEIFNGDNAERYKDGIPIGIRQSGDLADLTDESDDATEGNNDQES